MTFFRTAPDVAVEATRQNAEAFIPEISMEASTKIAKAIRSALEKYIERGIAEPDRGVAVFCLLMTPFAQLAQHIGLPKSEALKIASDIWDSVANGEL